MWRQWLTSRSWGWPSVCWVELNLRGRGETSGLVQKHLWLPSLQSRAGADHPEACWLEECLLFSGLGRAHRTLCLPGTGSLQTLALGLPASCQPYAVFFLWHPNMNVWIFAWLMRSYIRKASVGNIYKQANFLNENVLWIFFLRKKKLVSCAFWGFVHFNSVTKFREELAPCYPPPNLLSSLWNVEPKEGDRIRQAR